MKLNQELIALVVSIFSFTLVQCDWYEIRDEEIYENHLEAIQKHCRCYCSKVCGPRSVKRDDTPFYDEETGICFCKQWDHSNFYANGCSLRPFKDFQSCCDLDLE